MMATNTRTLSWPKRITGPLAGFFVLWAIVSLLTRRASQRSRMTPQQAYS